jgi:hypothetical protein
MLTRKSRIRLLLYRPTCTIKHPAAFCNPAGIIGNYSIYAVKYFIKFGKSPGVFLFGVELWNNYKILYVQVVDVQAISSGLIGLHGAGEYNRLKAVFF